MITQAQMRSLEIDLEKIARNQKAISPAILKDSLLGLGSTFQSELKRININENDLPHHAGLMLTPRIVKNVLDLVSVVDINKPEQVYLIFLLADFYSIFIYQVVKVAATERKQTFSDKDFEMLGYNVASDNRLKELYNLAKMSPQDFSKISLDKNQITYLKAAVTKIHLLFT